MALFSRSVILLVFFVTACAAPPLKPASETPNDNDKETSTRVVNTSPSVVTIGTPSMVPKQTPTETTVISRPLYQLNAILDLATHSLKVNEKISYSNTTGKILNELPFVIQANQDAGKFELVSLTWENGENIGSYSWQDHNLVVKLPEPLGQGKTVTVLIQYNLILSNKLKFPGWTERQTNLGDWYPYIPPFQAASGWIIHPPADVGENLAYGISDFQVTLSVEHASTNLMIASSAPTLPATEGYRYSVQSVRNFSLSISADYERIEAKSGNVDLSVFFFPEHRQAASAALDTVKRALSFFGDSFGTYKNTSLTAVESQVPDGMEYDGLFFLGQEYFSRFDGSTQSLLVALSAHETAHQWWYASVGNDPADEPWLDEALSTYSELLFYEQYYLNDVNWWWNYRITQFDPSGFVNSTIYDFKSFRPYVDAVYLRGVMFLDSIVALAGKEQFLVFLNGYAHLYQNRIVNSKDFFTLLVQYTHLDANVLQVSYFK